MTIEEIEAAFDAAQQGWTKTVNAIADGATDLDDEAAAYQAEMDKFSDLIDAQLVADGEDIGADDPMVELTEEETWAEYDALFAEADAMPEPVFVWVNPVPVWFVPLDLVI
jgi:hypothetical protein